MDNIKTAQEIIRALYPKDDEAGHPEIDAERLSIVIDVLDKNS